MIKSSRSAFLVATLSAFFILSFGAATRESATFDEPLHIASGYVSLKQHVLSLDPSNPPLIGYWMALPLLAYDIALPAPDPVFYARHGRSFSFGFVHHNRLSPRRLLMEPRIMIILLGVALGYLVFCWSEEVFGFSGGAASLIAFAFCPMLLAHGHLATTDMGQALLGTWALYRLYCWQKEPTNCNSLQVGLAFGLVMAAKFSSVILWPIALVAVGLAAYLKPRASHDVLSLRDGLIQGALMLGAAGITLALAYHVTALPEWFQGLRRIQTQIAEGHMAYFMGRFGTRGWPTYFWTAIILKTPVPLLISLFAGLWMAWRGSVPLRRWALWTLLPGGLFLGAGSFSSIQVGLRHALLFYPLLCLWTGGVAAALWNEGASRTRVLILFLGVYYVAASIWVFPRYLSYFNELAGGSSRGSRYFVDSNLDWGQGLKALGDYLRKNPGQLYLSYFGCDDPHNYGLRYTAVLPAMCTVLTDDGALKPEGGRVLFAVSAANRLGLFYTPHDVFSWLDGRKPAVTLLDSINVYDITNDAQAQRRLELLAILSKDQNL